MNARAELFSSRPDAAGLVFELVDHLDAMLAYWDENQMCGFANAAYRQWFGRSKEDMAHISLSQLLGPLYAKNLPYIEAAYRGEAQRFEREIPCPDGKLRHSLATYIPRIVDGKVRGIFVHVADVTPLKQLEGELRAAKAEAERLATHDFLTGLPNRVLLFDRIEQTLAHCARSGELAALVSLDIDDFKKINDNYGHPAGDRFLVEVARRLTHAVRQCDTVVRMGGDEFIILLTDLGSPEHASVMAERLVRSLAEPLDIDGRTIPASCSVGLALSAAGLPGGEAWIARSDRALYRAKGLGKNRFAFDTGPAPGSEAGTLSE
ncbi:MAG TPA: GGDEF domain-containing protein [Telluria sp.]|nr:GGDEF domain-containing protein [Telluria sp.]